MKSTNRHKQEAAGKKQVFRRNQTRTGVGVTIEKSDRSQSHRLRKLRRRLLGIVLVLLILAGFFGWLASQYRADFKINASSTQLSRTINPSDYQAKIEQYFNEHPLENFAFLTNYSQLTNYLQTDSPELVAVLPSTSNQHDLLFDLREPVASWNIDDRQYFVDAQGVTFVKNYFAEPSIVVNDKSGARINSGSSVAGGRLLSFVGRAVQLAADNGFEVVGLELPEQKTRQVNILIKDKAPVYMSIDRAAQAQIKDMMAVFDFLEAKKQTATYIDVRVPEKAFYK